MSRSSEPTAKVFSALSNRKGLPMTLYTVLLEFYQFFPGELKLVERLAMPISVT